MIFYNEFGFFFYSPSGLKIRFFFAFLIVTGIKKSEVPSSRRIIEKPPVYYVKLKVRNRAGKKSIIAPSYRGLNQGFHINTGSIMKITREFQSAEPLILKAFDPDSHSQMMINNRKSIIVKPAKLRNQVTDVVISPLSKCFCGVVAASFFPFWFAPQPFVFGVFCFILLSFFFCILSGGPLGPEKHFITLLVHNKVGREIRVEPSRGRKGGYVVPRSGFLKVSMIFPKTSAAVEPVVFAAEDLETENGLEINGDVKKVSITPGEFPDEMINMTITAPG